MKRAHLIFILGFACGGAALPGAAFADVACPEGRTITGECVNAPLATVLRETAIIFAQPKISHTTFPVLPAEDLDYRYPNQLIPDPNLPDAVRFILPPPPPRAPLPQVIHDRGGNRFGGQID